VRARGRPVFSGVPTSPGPAVRRFAPYLFSAAVALAFQLAVPLWYLHGNAPGFYADSDERFYATLVRHAAHAPLAETNPFDPVERRAASPYGLTFPQLLALPIRVGVDPGLTSDAERLAGGFVAALALYRIGELVAAPPVGVAMAVLVLLDVGTYPGKPVVTVLRSGLPGTADPQPLPFTRFYAPCLLLPLLALALLWLLWSVGPRGTRPRPWGAALAFLLLGVSGYFFFWSAAIAAAVAVAVLHPRRRRVIPWLLWTIPLLAALALLNGVGTRTAMQDVALRLGFLRTHQPEFLGNLGYWLAACGAGVLALAPWRQSGAARALGLAYLGAWVLAMIVSPLTGWDPQSAHFNFVLGPFATVLYCTLAWVGWRRWGRPRWIARTALVIVVAVAALGPVLAWRGYAASQRLGEVTLGEARRWIALGRIPSAAAVAVPREMRFAFALERAGGAFAYNYLLAWSVPDTVLWRRAVCAAALTGEDSAAVRRYSEPNGAFPTLWPDGRPADVSVAGLSDYFATMGILRGREMATVQRAGEDAAVLRDACAVHPDFALARGRDAVRRALRAASFLGGSAVRWRAPDSTAVWLAFPAAGPGSGAKRPSGGTAR
jgi:hypothetical protein